MDIQNILDPRIAAWVLDSSMASYHFDDILLNCLGIDNKATNVGSFVQTSPNKRKFFTDLLNCLRLMTNLRVKLEKDNSLDIFIDQEMHIVPILASTFCPPLPPLFLNVQ